MLFTSLNVPYHAKQVFQMSRTGVFWTFNCAVQLI